jgi:hypothetical protein
VILRGEIKLALEAVSLPAAYLFLAADPLLHEMYVGIVVRLRARGGRQVNDHYHRQWHKFAISGARSEELLGAVRSWTSRGRGKQCMVTIGSDDKSPPRRWSWMQMKL